MSILLEGLPPVDPRTLELMRDVFLFLKILGAAGMAAGLNQMRKWVTQNRADQAMGLRSPKKGRPNYPKSS